MTSKEKYNILNTCRLCMTELKNTGINCMEKKSLIHIIELLYRIKIHSNDKLSKKICASCFDSVTTFNFHFQIVKTTEKNQIQYLEMNQMTPENNDSDIEFVSSSEQTVKHIERKQATPNIHQKNNMASKTERPTATVSEVNRAVSTIEMTPQIRITKLNRFNSANDGKNLQVVSLKRKLEDTTKATTVLSALKSNSEISLTLKPCGDQKNAQTVPIAHVSMNGEQVKRVKFIRKTGPIRTNVLNKSSSSTGITNDFRIIPVGKCVLNQTMPSLPNGNTKGAPNAPESPIPQRVHATRPRSKPQHIVLKTTENGKQFMLLQKPSLKANSTEGQSIEKANPNLTPKIILDDVTHRQGQQPVHVRAVQSLAQEPSLSSSTHLRVRTVQSLNKSVGKAK